MEKWNTTFDFESKKEKEIKCDSLASLFLSVLNSTQVNWYRCCWFQHWKKTNMHILQSSISSIYCWSLSFYFFSFSIFSFDNFHIRFRNHGWMLSPDNRHSHCRWDCMTQSNSLAIFIIFIFWNQIVINISIRHIFFYLIFPFSKLTHIGNYRIEFMANNRQSMHCNTNPFLFPFA